MTFLIPPLINSKKEVNLNIDSNEVSEKQVQEVSIGKKYFYYILFDVTSTGFAK